MLSHAVTIEHSSIVMSSFSGEGAAVIRAQSPQSATIHTSEGVASVGHVCPQHLWWIPLSGGWSTGSRTLSPSPYKAPPSFSRPNSSCPEPMAPPGVFVLRPQDGNHIKTHAFFASGARPPGWPTSQGGVGTPRGCRLPRVTGNQRQFSASSIMVIMSLPWSPPGCVDPPRITDLTRTSRGIRSGTQARDIITLSDDSASRAHARTRAHPGFSLARACSLRRNSTKSLIT